MGEILKSFKGFNKDLTCRGFQYEIGKEYETTEPVKACESGFHACERPLDVFSYYSPGTSRFCEVEQSGDISREPGRSDSKVASSRIKIGAELGIPGLVKAQIEYVKAHTTFEHTDPKQASAGYRGAASAGESGAASAGYRGVASAGESGAASAGYRGAASAGYRGAASAGYRGAASAGSYGVASAGESGAASAGSYGVASAGYRGAASAGYRGAASAGESGAAVSRGTASAGEKGLAVARGNNVRVKGGLGAVLVICEEKTNNYDIAAWTAVVVDGEQIKADTWYQLQDGELKEVEVVD